jgi:hypothetical protein
MQQNHKESKPMIKTLSVTFVSAMLLAGVPALAADEHHPAGSTGEPAATMGAPGSQAPMGGMMSMMGNGAMPMMGMMTDHMEGRLAFLKTELKITDLQEPKWNAFAEAARGSIKVMANMRQGMMQTAQLALPARIDLSEKALSASLEALQKLKAALEPLYESFSDEQKHVADQLMISPMGMLGMM